MGLKVRKGEINLTYNQLDTFRGVGLGLGEPRKSSTRSWNEIFEKLKAHKEQHGNCAVPQRFKADPRLSNWVGQQRRAYKSEALCVDRKGQLESSGFVRRLRGNVPDQIGRSWNESFEKLKYKEQHGNCAVPLKFQADPPLGHWVGKQRETYKNATLNEDRIGQQESSGFVWRLRGNVPDQIGRAWNESFEKLKYKEHHGNCAVPQKFQADPRLGNWVGQHQRLFTKVRHFVWTAW
jgi:hypothetical protein